MRSEVPRGGRGRNWRSMARDGWRRALAQIPPRFGGRRSLRGGAIVAAVVAAVVAVGFAVTSAPARAEVTLKVYRNLDAAFDNVGITDDATTAAGDLDGAGDSFSSDDLSLAGWTQGATLTVSGATFTLPDVPPGRPDNVVADGQHISVRGSGAALAFLVTSSGGQTSGTGTISYADGRSQTFRLTAPDWQTGPTDTMSVNLPNRDTPLGPEATPVRLYTVSVPLDSRDLLREVTLPRISGTAAANTAAMHVFALGVRPAAGAWTASWAAAMDDGLVPGPWTNRTLRMVEHTSVGGSPVRVRLDNDFAPSPVVIGHVTVAVEGSASAAASPPVTVTFHGSQDVTIPAGAQAISDPVGFDAPANTNLLVSVYLPGTVELAPQHSFGGETMYSTADGVGDQTTDISDFPTHNTFGFWTLVSGIDVVPAHAVGTVVAFGDSITDGIQSTVGANARYPDDLARRLLQQHAYPPLGVVDEGISANEVAGDLFDGLYGSGNGGIAGVARLDRDMVSQSGVRTVMILEGINDIDKASRQAAPIIAGLRLMAATAHAYGLRVIVSTVLPDEGYTAYSPAREAVRQAVNAFIRNNGGAFDSVIDLDQVMRDPADPLRLNPAYDSGDHLHPNDAGYLAMADAVDLADLYRAPGLPG